MENVGVESGLLGSGPEAAGDSLCDLGQIIPPLCNPVEPSVRLGYFCTSQGCCGALLFVKNKTVPHMKEAHRNVESWIFYYYPAHLGMDLMDFSTVPFV